MNDTASAKPWVTVVSPTLTENTVFRTWVIVKLLEPSFRVQLVGFGRPGESYPPLRHDPSMVYDRIYHATNVVGWWREVKRLAPAIRGEALICIKPKLPSFGAGLLLKRRLGLPVVVDVDDWERGFLFAGALDWEVRFHGLGWFTRPTSPLYTRWLEGRIPSADAVLISNSFLQGMFGGHWIPHFRDAELPPPAHVPRPDGRKVVLFAGTPRTHKGIGTLVEAWRLLGRKDAVLHLVVPNPATDVAGIGIERLSNVEVTGPYPFAELQRLLGEASVVVVPQDNARGALGQLPAKLLDAMAAGRPIVATDVGDAARWLAGDAGVVVSPGSPGDLAAGIGYLLDHLDIGEQMGVRARARVQQYASRTVLASRLRDVVVAAIEREPLPTEPVFGTLFVQSGTRQLQSIP